MGHNLKISVSKKPVNRGVVSCRKVTVRERLVRFLFGNKVKLTVIVPGNSVRSISVTEVDDGGGVGDALVARGIVAQTYIVSIPCNAAILAPFTM